MPFSFSNRASGLSGIGPCRHRAVSFVTKPNHVLTSAGLWLKAEIWLAHKKFGIKRFARPGCPMQRTLFFHNLCLNLSALSFSIK